MYTKLVVFCALFIALASGAHNSLQCLATPLSEFRNGHQHCDCGYVQPSNLPVNEQPTRVDFHWMQLVHQFALVNSPGAPFGAAIVDTRNNSLVCIGANKRNSNDPVYGNFLGHAEIVTMGNCSTLFLPDVHDAFGNKINNPDWQYMTLYGNIEACPMCAQAAIWRGLNKMVFGARASALASERCWTQSGTTARELVDQSSSFAPFQYVRGPIYALEQEIVNGFPNFCPSK